MVLEGLASSYTAEHLVSSFVSSYSALLSATFRTERGDVLKGRFS
jgi:hypothetical protein